jgi:hypothetical protein
MGGYRTDEIMVWFRTQIPRRRANTSPIYRPDGKLGRRDTMITKDKWPTVHKALPRAASSYGHGEWIVCANGG